MTFREVLLFTSSQSMSGCIPPKALLDCPIWCDEIFVERVIQEVSDVSIVVFPSRPFG